MSQPFCPFGLGSSHRRLYDGPAPASITPAVREEMSWRLGLWRAAKGKPHEPNAALYVLALLRQHYPADHPRVVHWQSKVNALGGAPR